MLYLKKKATLLLVAAGASLSALAQEVNGIWHAEPASYLETHGKPVLQPEKFSVFTASESTLKSFLEGVSQDYSQAQTIVIPQPQGGYRNFRIWSTPVMEAPLARKYQDITTYTAEALDNRRVTAKIDYTPYGFHAMVYDADKTYFVDPYSSKADGAYIAYYKKDYIRPLEKHMVCEVEDGGILQTGNGETAQRLNGTTRKQYRLALAADSEYCAAVAGANPTKAAVLAKMVVSVNRVNGVYERELAVTMVLVGNNDTLIFTGADPYTNNSGSTMLNQNQTTVNARIGAANYDIGHVFSTGGGGIAQRGSVCSNSNKARGVTGSPSPQGDAFDIDYVAHEMGHQFGADHTFNASTGSCAGNGVASSSMEPGAGSTIMAYAGICGSGNDFQAHSDAYFHSASLEQITNFITVLNGSTCASVSPSTNTNAILPPFSASYNIPFRTPFELTAPDAIDTTADTLTYCWEQRNTGGADFGKSLAATRLAGPLFRSFPPSISPTRVFPNLNRLLLGTSTPGEKLPDTGRVMKFRLTERDIYQGWGTFNFPDDSIMINVIQTSGPFAVSNPQGGGSWTCSSYQFVTWDVSGTDASPISCSTVDILLSIDGGFTWPIVLAAATPNDGSEAIVVPNFPAAINMARVKVKGNGNIFFNINSGGNFDINLDPLGTGTTALDKEVAIAPVPASSNLQISLPASYGVVEGKLVNTMGQQVWSGNLKGAETISVAQFPRGVYYLQLSGHGLSATRTVVLK